MAVETLITVAFDDDEKAKTFLKVMETSSCHWMPDRVVKVEWPDEDAESKRSP